MVIYKEWVDFVIYPGNAQQVHTHKQRLDVSNAVDLDKIDPNDTAIMSAAVDIARERGALASKLVILANDDQFEAMEIDDYGNVTIWTKQKVWELRRQYGFDPKGYEKLFFSRRHPPE